MIQFSEGTAIALHAMIYIVNRSDKVVSLKEIADKFQISSNHLSKILQRLAKAGYLNSTKGPNGGFKVTEYGKNISFMDVYIAIEGSHTMRECLFSSKSTKCRRCIMSGLISKFNEDFHDYMVTNKINDPNFKL